MGEGSYGRDDVSLDLTRIRDGSASFEDRARLESFLLRRLQEEGNDGVAAVLNQVEGFEFSLAETSGSGDRLYIGASSAGPGLVVTTHLSESLASVDVSHHSESPSMDPRHRAFYSIWEGLLSATSSEVAALDPTRRAVYMVGLLEAELMNGGFGQYLTNTDGEHLEETLVFLKRIGADRTHALLVEAVELGSAAESYAAAWDDESKGFDRLDSAFLESGEDLAGLTADAFLETG